jgi:hypothetical protein
MNQTFETGTRFKIEDERDYYMLSQIDYGTYSLINVINGNRFSDPRKSDLDNPLPLYFIQELAKGYKITPLE